MSNPTSNLVVTMVKKRLASGEPCRKCVQAEELLKSRGLWERIDVVVWADENDPSSPGMQLAALHKVDLAPFFLIKDAAGERLHTSTLKLIKELTEPGASGEAGSSQGPAAAAEATQSSTLGLAVVAAEYATKTPTEILSWGLNRFGRDCAIAFSGAEDVVLIDMAAKTGLPYSVFCLDTGRLHAETYRFIERVREHYGITIAMIHPAPELLEPFVEQKGLFSFYRDNHAECCGIRKVEPLKRALSRYSAWVTGQRKDQSPATRGDLQVVLADRSFSGKPTATSSASGTLVKLNPLAAQSLKDVWQYIEKHNVPFNPLHERGFVSIGCEPCTRAPRPGEHERAGRWWWEAETQRECGLHVAKG